MFFGISKNGMTLQSAIIALMPRMLMVGFRYFILIPFLLVCLSVQAQKSQVDTDPNQLYFQGLDYVKQQNFIYAKELFTKYIERKEVMNEKKSQDLVSNAKFYRALCALELGQPDAEKLFEDYIKQEDESPTKKIAYYHLGRLLFDNKKYKEAIEYFEQVDQFDLSRSERDEYRFELAYCYFHSKKLDEAYKLFRQTKDVTNKYYYPSNYYYGYISYTQKKFDDALQSFEKLKESKTYEKIIPYYIAQIYFQRKQYDKVIEYLQPLIGESSLKYYEELNLILGQANYEKKNYEKAIKHIKIYVDRNKPRKEELYQLGYAYYQTKKYNEAITNLQQLDDLTDSIGQSALYILGDCFLKTGNKQNALSAFQKASKIDIDKFIVENSFFNYAKLSYELGYDKQAIVAFQSFINDYPDSEYSEDAKGMLSDLLLTTKNYKDALVIIESIHNKTPKVKKAYQQIAFLRGLEVYNDKNYIEAIRLFNVSLKNPIAPDFKALSYYWLGECNYQLEQYNAAFNEYVKFLELSAGTDIKDANWYLTNAHYSAGYAQFKQQQYATAAKYFAQAVDKSQISTKPDAKNKIYPDASLRNGDCNFMLKNYPVAISSYDVVAQNNAPGSDYALFQKGTILGLQGRYEEKIQTLEKVAIKYPTSAYNDDAQYNIGDAYVSLGKSQTAATTFNNLIQKYPNSPFVSKSYLKLGLIYYNQDNVKKSVESYRIILDKYPKSNDAKEALIALKDMSIAEGDPDIYMDIISTRKDIQVSVSEKDSISFLAAETRYAKGQCDEAIKKFDDYLTNFPNGYFLLQAYFYRSECLFKMKKYVESVKGYEYVANAGMNIYREKALAKASEINYYELKDYTNAEKYYLLLLENASNNDNIFIANLGLMRCAYHQNNLSQANTYAEKILGSNQSTPEQVIEANFYVAKYNQLNKSYGTALNHYKKVAAKTTNIIGAESQYQIALIHFEENKLKEAEDESFNVIDNFSSYDYWYIKAYMLIADIYEKQGNLFQAKATLQSVIENAEDEKLKAEALEKLNKIYEKETKTSNLVPDGMNIDAPLDTIEIK